MTEKLTKLTLPRDVAEAIDDVKQFYRDAEILMTVITDNGRTAYGTGMGRLVTYSQESKGNLENLLTALVNGYTIEQSPEEKLRKYYEDMRDSSEGSIYWIRSEGVLNTLSILGIQIEGINA